MHAIHRSPSPISRPQVLLGLIVVLLIAFLLPEVAVAADETAKTLPYQKGIDVFYTSMTGPVPFIISLMGIVGCGAMLIFGGEISGFMRTMVFIILVVAVIVQASSVVSLLGGEWAGQTPGGQASVLAPASRQPG